MNALVTLLAASLAAQPEAAARDAAAAEQAARAAQTAAEAAQRAAEAAQRAAEAAAKVLAVVPARLEVPAAPAPSAAPAPGAWSGTVGLGMVSLTGNSRSITFTANAAGERKSADWILRAKAYGTYGESRSASTGLDEKVAEAAGLLLRADRVLEKRYSAYVLGAVDADHVKSVELRSAGELGATLVWLETPAERPGPYLRTDLGFRVSEERRYQYYPTEAALSAVMQYAPRAGLAFRYALSKDVLFTEDAEVLPNVVGDSRVLASSVTKIQTRLSRTLAFGVSFTVSHDSDPAPGKVETDTQLALTLDVLL